MQDASGRKLSGREYAGNTLHGIVKALPYGVGSALDQFIYGPAQERRWRRLESTLTEVLEAVNAPGSRGRVDTEEFVKMLEDVAKPIARATNEDVRQRLRDLLINSSSIPAGDPGWEEAELARELIENIAAPGLALIAALARFPESDPWRTGGNQDLSCWLVAPPSPQVVLGPFDFQAPTLRGVALNYDWEVLSEWVWRLKERRILSSLQGAGDNGFQGVRFAKLGLLIVRWATRN